MKIKVWLFSIIVAGALLLGAAGGFVLSQGFSLAVLMAQHMKAALANNAPRIQVQIPDGQSGGWYQQGGRNQGGSSGGQFGSPWGGQQDQADGDALPQSFNAGVSIPGTYGEMTSRTEEQVLAEAEKAGTDTFGLAKQEGKLDELKTKLLEKVTTSLNKMVADGTITEGQKATYLTRVTLILQVAGQTQTNVFPDGDGGNRDGGKPDA